MRVCQGGCVNGLVRYCVVCAEPNDESPANVDAAVSCLLECGLCLPVYVHPQFLVLQKLWRNDRKKFNEIADHVVRKSLGLL